MDARFGSNQKDASACSISSDQIDRLWAVYRSSAAFTAAQKLIKSRLLGMGIVYTRGNQLVDRRLYDHVQRFFVPFISEVLDSIWVCGFAAYTLTTDHMTGLPMPTVVPPGHVQYEIYTDPLSCRQMLRQQVQPSGNKEQRNQKRSLFFVTKTFPDCKTGAIHSAVRSVYETHLFSKRIEETVVIGERVRCQPPIVTTSKTDHQFDERDLVITRRSMGCEHTLQKKISKSETASAWIFLRNRTSSWVV